MPKPTQADWNAFSKSSSEEKAKVLFLYLCQEKVTMEKVVNMVYHISDPQYTKKVSRITRCYGFEGNNGGRFGKLGVTYEDVLAFVDEYPNGTDYDGGKTMEEYLLGISGSTVDKYYYDDDGDKITLGKGIFLVCVLIFLVVIIFVLRKVFEFGWILSIAVGFVITIVVSKTTSFVYRKIKNR